MDGRTAGVLARLLAAVETDGGEVVLTKTAGAWSGQVIVGDGHPVRARWATTVTGPTMFTVLHQLHDAAGLRAPSVADAGLFTPAGGTP